MTTDPNLDIPKALVLSFRDDLEIHDLDDGGLRFAGRQFSFQLTDLSATVRVGIALLRAGGLDEGHLRQRLITDHGVFSWLQMKSYLDGMAGLLRRTLKDGGQPYASLVPHTTPADYRVDGRAFDPSEAYRLSRFAYCLPEGGHLVVASPLGHSRVVLHQTSAAALVAELTEGRTAAQLAAATDTSPDLCARLLFMLLRSGALTTVDGGGRAAEDDDPALAHWEFHDLLFHSRTRLGRHDQPYGGTYRFRGLRDPLPVVKAPMDGEVIALEKPDLTVVAASDPDFTTVLEGRRSIRSYDDAQPIHRDQLGEFLYRVARIKKIFDPDSAGQSLCFRPYPGGGSIHELEIYPVVGRCDGLPPGLYHYRALEHRLCRLGEMTEGVERILRMGTSTLKQDTRPQILLVITARFQRVQWKYQSMAYALVLKNVGVLYQTMYLVATAMGLAPCAMGGGHSDLFASVAGLDYSTETSVGELALGSRGQDPDDIARPYHRKDA